MVAPPSTGTARGEGTFTMPDDADDIIFRVLGAGGGGASGTGSGTGPGSRAIHYPGGAGHNISGELNIGVRGQQVQLIAGRGGGIAGAEATTSVGGEGFGAGGSSIGIHGTANATVLLRARGGGGGGASALRVSSVTQVIAGAGGGGGGYAWALANGITATGETSAHGGAAETNGGFPQHTFTGTANGSATALNMNPASAGGGRGAGTSIPGGVPSVINFTATTSGYSGGLNAPWRWPNDGCRQRSNMRPIRRSKTRPPVRRVLVCRVLGSDAGQGVDPAVA